MGYSVKQTTHGEYVLTRYSQSFASGKSDICLVKTDIEGNEEWNQTFGGSDDDMGYSVNQTTDGGYVLTGYSQSFGSGESDVWLIKTDGQGNELWRKTFGDGYGLSVQQTVDGGFIVTGFDDNDDVVFLLKTDKLGNIEYLKD